ncbi:hypothetical protein ASG07_15485 [Sphingomonas sp. Leaf343]|nr:DDE-type integrase/transposase/recombinase [Sphingomonas sp. Leaf343]KQR80540.1 hypothetical protein ASG07_15485 [Sphingomonas sp. Leaf343]
MRGFRHWRWHLDEMYVKLNGELVYLWRAVDHEGEVLESYVTRTRDKAAALAFIKKALKGTVKPNARARRGVGAKGLFNVASYSDWAVSAADPVGLVSGMLPFACRAAGKRGGNSPSNQQSSCFDRAIMTYLPVRHHGMANG